MKIKKTKNFYKNKKVIVTGGTGLIGRAIVKKLCDYNAKVTVISLDKLILDKRAKYIYGDLCSFDFCKKITKKTDYAFHISGIKGSVKATLEKPASFFVPLLMMNTNFLEACRINKVKRLVYTSSIGAYSSMSVFKEESANIEKSPMDMYPGWAKRMAELQIISYKKQYKLKNYFVVRPCNVYGPGDNFDPKNAMVIPTLIRRIYRKENPVVIWGDGSAIRDFAFSDDVADGVINTLIYGTGKYDFLNLGGGRGYKIKDLVKALRSFLNFNYKFDSSKNSGWPKRVMSIKNSNKIIKFNPKTSLTEGLQKTWDWYITNSKEFVKRKNYLSE